MCRARVDDKDRQPGHQPGDPDADRNHGEIQYPGKLAARSGRIRYGYMNGIALTVLIGQLPKLFGFSIEAEGPLRKLWAIGQAILGGRTNWTALAVGAVTLAVIFLLKNRKRIPGILIAVIGATAIVGALDLATRADVSVLGPLPRGLPTFAIPWITYSDIVPVLIGGCAIALVSFADTSVLSRAYAARTGTSVDPNQE